jgi:hypothetical protein
MTTNVIWPIEVDNVQDMLRVKNKLEYPVNVWACGLSEGGDQILIAVEVDDCDLDKLGVDDFTLYDEGEVIQ